MKEILLAGVDVSKLSLDIFVKPCGVSLVIDNNQKGFMQWWKEMKKIVQSDTRVMVVMEHTGLYSTHMGMVVLEPNGQRWLQTIWLGVFALKHLINY